MNARERLHRMLALRTGIELSRGGVAQTLDRFLERRLAQLRLAALDDYLEVLRHPSGAELERLTNAVTVVYTWFFRDYGQLAAIEALLAREPSPRRPLSVWVAGCATGEDAYSIALLAARRGRSVDVLGTDLNTEALAHARVGRYTGWSLREVRGPMLSYFTAGPGGSWTVADSIRSRVRFERQNLLDAPPPPPARSSPSGGSEATETTDSAGWDIILCRNVLIYFDRPRARRVFERLAEALSPGGHLLLGASEVVFDVPADLEATYVADRLAFRRMTATSGALASPRPRSPERPPIRGRRARSWTGPLPALPSVAAQIAGAPPAVSNTDPGRQEGLLASGHALLDSGDVRSARDAYMKAVASDNTWADARMYAGIAAYLCGDVEAALHELRAALFLDGELWPAAFYLALCHENMGHAHEALREYRHVVRISERRASEALPAHPVLTAWHQDLLDLARQRVAQAAPAEEPAPGRAR